MSKRKFLAVFIIIFIPVIFVIALGFIKFNILQDDIYYDGQMVDVMHLEGKWVQTFPTLEYEQGFWLKNDGRWEAIGTKDLVYESWGIKSGVLTLAYRQEGKSLDEIVLEITAFREGVLQITDQKGQELRYERRD